MASEVDWRVGLTFQERMLHLLEGSLETDVEFEVYDTQDLGKTNLLTILKCSISGAGRTFIVRV